MFVLSDKRTLFGYVVIPNNWETQLGWDLDKSEYSQWVSYLMPRKFFLFKTRKCKNLIMNWPSIYAEGLFSHIWCVCWKLGLCLKTCFVLMYSLPHSVFEHTYITSCAYLLTSRIQFAESWAYLSVERRTPPQTLPVSCIEATKSERSSSFLCSAVPC